jgi:hypothetical protein
MEQESQNNLPPDLEDCKKVLTINKNTLESKLFTGHLASYNNNSGNLKNIEIMGHEKNVEKLKRMFQNTSVRIKIIQEGKRNRSNSNNSTEDDSETVTEKGMSLSRGFRDSIFNYHKTKRNSIAVPDIVVQCYRDNTDSLFEDPKEIKSDNDTSSDSGIYFHHPT